MRPMHLAEIERIRQEFEGYRILPELRRGQQVMIRPVSLDASRSD
ncbi:hypothetical protein [Bradyrhizobium sp. RDM4]